MKRRSAGVAVVGFLAAVSIGFSAQPASAAGTLDVPDTTVAAGTDLKFTVTGCPFQENQTWAQEAKVVLVTGTPPNQILAGQAFSGDDSGQEHKVIHVPRWVDPAEPATLIGECRRIDFTGHDPSEWTTSVQFEFPDVPIDITPKSGSAPGPALAPERNTAAGGQVIIEAATGCKPNNWVQVRLYGGDDLTGMNLGGFATFVQARTGPDGSALVDLALLAGDLSTFPDGALPEGTYTVLGGCGSGDAYQLDYAAPHLITVSGTNPSTEVDLKVEAGRVVASGAGCTGGQEVTVKLEDNTSAIPSLTAAPAADGTWSTDMSEPTGRSYAISATADCGDPTADGFRYVSRFVQGGHDEPPPVATTDPAAQSGTAQTPTAPAADPVSGSPAFTG